MLLKSTFITFLLVLGAFLVLGAKIISPYLIAVLMGSLLALICRPAYLKMIKRGIPHKLSAFALVIALTFAVILPVGFFTVEAVRQGVVFAEHISNNHSDLDDWIGRLSDLGPMKRIFSQDQLKTQIKSVASKESVTAITYFEGFFGGVPQALFQLVMALISCYFLLVDGQRFLAWMDERVPLDREVKTKLYRSFKDTSISTVLATLILASAHTGLVLVSFLILKVPAAFLAGGAAFIFAWLPLIGTTPIWLAGATYLSFTSGLASGLVLIALGGLAGIMDYSVRPWVLKGRSHIHSLVGLLSIFGGIELFGIMGVFLGPIIAGVLIALLTVWLDIGRRFQVLPSGSAEPIKRPPHSHKIKLVRKPQHPS
jgi:predicted PurR-regulated permease PerM